MDPENQFAYQAEVVRCHACATQQKAVQQFADSGGDQAGVLARMTRYPKHSG